MKRKKSKSNASAPYLVRLGPQLEEIRAAQEAKIAAGLSSPFDYVHVVTGEPITAEMAEGILQDYVARGLLTEQIAQRHRAQHQLRARAAGTAAP